MKWQQVYRRSDNRFLAGGYFDVSSSDGFDSDVCGICEMDAPPNSESERYDETSPSLKRSATQAELNAAVVEQVDDAAQREAALRVVRATVVYVFRQLNGRNPTIAELQAKMIEWKNIYKALP